jgi:hypothetical protein
VIPLVFIGLAAVAGTVGAFVYFNSDFHKLRKALKTTPRIAIAEFPDGGHGTIVGRVKLADAGMLAPLTGRRCSYYQAVVERQRSNNNSSSWYQIIFESGGVPFEVDDGSGSRAIVDPRGAKTVLVMDSTTRSGTFDDATEAEEAFLARYGKESKGLIFNKTLRYKEGVLEEGETIAVLGVGVREPDPAAVDASRGYRELPRTRLRMGGSRKLPIILTDDPRLVGD